MKRVLIIFLVILVCGVLLIAAAGRSTKPLAADAVADLVVVDKSERRLSIYRGNDVIKNYEVSLGRNPEGHKEREGDNRTPEGEYKIDFHKRDSSFHRALHISYPNPTDIARAQARSVPPGGDIMIHGLPNRLWFIGRTHLARDWTQGCIAVTNQEIEELWRAVPDGTKIVVQP